MDESEYLELHQELVTQVAKYLAGRKFTTKVMVFGNADKNTKFGIFTWSSMRPWKITYPQWCRGWSGHSNPDKGRITNYA
jgi:hypothetical protein